MTTIWKFPLPLRVMSDGLAEIGWFDLKMPKLTTPISVGVQGDAPVLWGIVEPSETVNHQFVLVGTGKEMPEYHGTFVGTYQIGRFVGHVFYLGYGR
jgi:hypothetical protein